LVFFFPFSFVFPLVLSSHCYLLTPLFKSNFHYQTFILNLTPTQV
jgi:hypothetical protein